MTTDFDHRYPGFANAPEQSAQKPEILSLQVQCPGCKKVIFIIAEGTHTCTSCGEWQFVVESHKVKKA
jgi:ribosomal protein S27E